MAAQHHSDSGESLPFLSEARVAQLVDQAAVTQAISDIFVAMSSGGARNFPVVREQLGHQDAIYGFKSGIFAGSGILGLKAGGFWPHNAGTGLANHQSSVFLFDLETGRLKAVVSGNRLTALRTAAASALSIRHLAREESTVLGIVGAGGQAGFQLRAAVAERSFEQIIICDRDRERAGQLARDIDGLVPAINVDDVATMAGRADVIITVTPSFHPVIEADWVRPGTHLACMGADTAGKQEVATDLTVSAHRFTDEVAQSISIGECQHAYRAGRIGDDEIIPLGSVIAGTHKGRQSSSQITMFDGTGVGLQDLAAADLVCRKAGLV